MSCTAVEKKVIAGEGAAPRVQGSQSPWTLAEIPSSREKRRWYFLSLLFSFVFPFFPILLSTEFFSKFPF